MSTKIVIRTIVALAAMFLLTLSGCSDNNPTEPAPFPTDPRVFLDGFAPNTTYQAFLGSDLDALQIDEITAQSGTRSLIVSVPEEGSAEGSFAGGAFTATIARDLSSYNALTFWAKADMAATLNVAGLGNDNTGTSRFTAEVNNLPLSTSWTKYVVPIPLPQKLTMEQGLFYFAEGHEGGAGYNLWFDEVQFETLGTISNPQPTIPTDTIDVEVGDTISVTGATVTFDVDGSPVTVSAMPGYFTFVSSDDAVVSVAGNGAITASGVGTVELTATLGATLASGSILVNVVEPLDVPLTPAPTPTVPAADVISLFSDAYTDVNVETWSTDWGVAEYSEETIGTDNVKKYSSLSFAGIQFADPTVDATGMTRFHMDIWTPNSTTPPANFKVKLVDFGADSAFGGVDDVEHELTFTENTSPGLASQSWVSIDVPLSAFSGLLTRGHMAQIVISGSLSTVYVDNVFFYDAGAVTEPELPAPTPTKDPGSVISLFSDAYTDVPVDNWSATWDNATVEDFAIGSDSIKKYTNLSPAGIEFRTTTIDASAMTHFHMDFWTPDPTSSPAQFKVKLLDLGPDGVSGGGDDSDHELIFDHTTMSTGIWVSIDVAMDEFATLVSREHLATLRIECNPNTVFIDNIYFYDSGIPLAPPDPAPTPSHNPADVISLFSDAYTDVTVDTWSADWPDEADVADVLVGTDNVKKYTSLVYAGIEFTSNTIDASAMTHFHMDVWTPDPTDAPAVFKIKLVDFGANGTWDEGGPGDDVEHEITLGSATMNTGTWVSIDLPLTDFTGLTTKAHLAQLIISGDPNTVFVDNVYFHK